MEKQPNLKFDFNKPAQLETKNNNLDSAKKTKYFNIDTSPLPALIICIFLAIILATMGIKYKNQSKEVYLPTQISHSGYGSDVSQQQAAIMGSQLTMATQQMINNRIEQSSNNIILLKQYLKEVQAITPNEMKAINSFINEVKQMEYKRLNELTLKIKYVANKNPSRYNYSEAFIKISQLKIDTADYYNGILIDINRSHKIAKNTTEADFEKINGNFATPAIDSLKEIIQWKNYKDLNIKPTLGENDEIIVSWAPSIVNQDGIEEYLSKNKAFINEVPKN